MSLYRRAFAEFRAQALWNKRMFDEPTSEDALVVARSLRIEGNRQARLLAEQIEQACRAAARPVAEQSRNHRGHDGTLQAITMNAIPDIPGATDVVSWFGNWPSFHDAEIISLNLHRSVPSTLILHAWNMTGNVDASQHFVLEKHALVTFTLLGVSDLELDDFSDQNVIGSLAIETHERGFRITLSPCYGLCGTIAAERVSVSVQPCKPDSANNPIQHTP